jgi:hypothetical protein
MSPNKPSKMPQMTNNLSGSARLKLEDLRTEMAIKAPQPLSNRRERKV